MAATYEPITTVTLGSNATEYTFSSIPSTYTDLRLIVSALSISSQTPSLYLRFNSDSAGNYNHTVAWGNGASVGSYSENNISAISFTGAGNLVSNYPGLCTADILSYANTSVHKTTLNTASLDRSGAGTVSRVIGLWRSTSAINSITVTTITANSMGAGSTLTLYGIKAA